MRDEVETAKLAGLAEMERHIEDVTPMEYVKAEAMFLGYVERYKDDPHVPIEAEAERAMEVSETGYTVFGKLDTLANLDDQLVQLEHKTGKNDADYPEKIFPFRTASVSEQITMYSMLMSASGNPLHHTIIDYVKTPGLIPKLVKQGYKLEDEGSVWEIATHGTYFGEPVQESTKLMYKEGKKNKENHDLYGIRVRQHIAANMDKYYNRSQRIFRTNLEMVEQLVSIEQLISDIELAEKGGINAHYQNTSQCLAYNSKCEFYGLCDGTSDIGGEDWQPRQGGNKKSSKMLSFSKGTTFKSCRRKYFYRYVKEIEKRGYGTASLRLGSLFHIGLEFYFRSLITQQETNDE
jgi:hypothetical protein